MQRRNFIKNTALSAAALSAVPLAAHASTAGPAPAFKLNYAPHIGMFENSAGKDPADQIRYMADQGFRALEDNGMMGRPVAEQEKMAKAMRDTGIQMGVFVVAFDGWPPKTTLASGDAGWRDKFLTACRSAMDVAKRLNARWMTVVPGNFDRNMPMGLQTGHVIDSLRRGAEIFEPHGLVMVLEPLSDTPDLFMRYSDQTYALCRAVNSPACKILFDMWHMQRNEGRLIHNMNLCWEEIAYFQIGDEPGRKEPTTGEINYKNIFKHIHGKGFTGILGMEHGNFSGGKEGEMAVVRAYREVDGF